MCDLWFNKQISCWWLLWHFMSIISETKKHLWGFWLELNPKNIGFFLGVGTVGWFYTPLKLKTICLGNTEHPGHVNKKTHPLSPHSYECNYTKYLCDTCIIASALKKRSLWNNPYISSLSSLKLTGINWDFGGIFPQTNLWAISWSDHQKSSGWRL